MPKSRKEMLDWLAADPGLSLLLAEAERHEGEDAAHDLSHLLRVAAWAMELAPQLDPREAAAAALLHDLVNLPKDHPERAKASEYSAQKAGPLLAQAGFPPEASARIQGAIRDHSFSRGAKPESELGAVIQDADRLEALGAIGLMRLISTGSRMRAAYFNSADPWAKNRPLEDRKYSFDHFFTKLLKLPATFHTEAGRREAAKRAAYLENFLDQAAAELGEPRP